MKNRLILTTGLMALASLAWAQGGISQQMIGDMERALETTGQSKALFNALAGNKIDDLARSFESRRTLDTHFSIETEKQSITDQESSGRCWMFSGMNVLRANFAQREDSLVGFKPKKSGVQLEFSQVHLFFYDQLEKANLFLQGIIDTAKKPIDDVRVQFFFKAPISDGGTFCGVADLAEKYGLVPKDVMPETYSAENTSKMAQIMKSKLREQGLELRDMVARGKKASDLQKRKTEMLKEIYRMLSLTLGEPVKQFTYAFHDRSGKALAPARQYTPKEFYETVVGGPINGTFIMVMNDPRREYHKTYEVEYDRHVYDGHNWVYLNLPMDDIEQMAIASLRDGRKLYSSYDVGKQLDRTRGYCDLENFDYASLFGTTFNMDKAQRISTFDSGSTHAMTLTAVDLDDEGKATKWKVENSWGAAWGQQGCLIMSDRWFREYMFRLVVNKKYVSEQLLREAQQKPVMVMPEDPLFGMDDD
ncbi:MAG: C1 family peptidase [Prevotella sp.]|nr:C1 family peptidase [Prevotella sp.]